MPVVGPPLAKSEESKAQLSAQSSAAENHNLHLSAVRTPTQSTTCFRISNVPEEWSKEKLLQILEQLEGPNSSDHPTGRLWLYPACCDSSQTALWSCTQSRALHDLGLEKKKYIPLEEEDDDLVIDRHFYGLTPLNTPDPENGIVADIVAVNGLAGHAFESWRNSDSKRMWLRDFLPKTVKRVRIMTYGYNTKLDGSRTRDSTLLDHKRDLIEKLNNARSSPEEQKRPIIFLGHGLGGILILEVLAHCNLDTALEAEKRILSTTIALFFFGTPHLGMLTEEMQTMVKGLGEETRSVELLKQIQEGSQYLERLRREVIGILERCKVFTYYETEKTPTLNEPYPEQSEISREPKKVVENRSAMLFLLEERTIPVDADHRSMVMFNSLADETYISVSSHINQCIDSITGQKKEEKEVDDRRTYPQVVTSSSADGIDNASDVSNHSTLPPPYPSTEHTLPLFRNATSKSIHPLNPSDTDLDKAKGNCTTAG